MATVNARDFRDSITAAIMPDLGCSPTAANEFHGEFCVTHQCGILEGSCLAALVIANDSLVSLMKSVRESREDGALQEFRLSL